MNFGTSTESNYDMDNIDRLDSFSCNNQWNEKLSNNFDTTLKINGIIIIKKLFAALIFENFGLICQFSLFNEILPLILFKMAMENMFLASREQLIS